MNLKKLLVVTSILFSYSAASVMAYRGDPNLNKPTERSGLSRQQRVNFDSIHGNSDATFGGNAIRARGIIRDAAKAAANFDDSEMFAEGNAARNLDKAIREANNACGEGSEEFSKLLTILYSAPVTIIDAEDKLAVLLGGVNFLLTNRPTTMTNDILSMGLSMCAPAMNKYRNVANVMEVVCSKAKDASKDMATARALYFAILIGNDIAEDAASRYMGMSSVASTIVDAESNENLFLQILTRISETSFSSNLDQAGILEAGLEQYPKFATSECHRQVAQIITDASGTKHLEFRQQIKVRILVAGVAYMSELSPTTPVGDAVSTANVVIEQARKG